MQLVSRERFQSEAKVARTYLKHELDELRALVLKHADEPGVLGPIHEELTYRSTDGAVQLRREVRALLDGTAPPPPKKDVPDVPGNQRSLF